MSMCWLWVAALIVAPGPGEDASVVLRVPSLMALAGSETVGAELSTEEDGTSARTVVTVDGGEGAITIPLPSLADSPPGLRLALQGQRREGSGALWADLLSSGETVASQPVWLGRSWSASRAVLPLDSSRPPDALRLRMSGRGQLLLGGLLVDEAWHMPPHRDIETRIANGGFELGMAGWAPYGTVAPVVRIVDSRPGSGRWCAELTNRSALLPVVYEPWPMPSVGSPERVGMISQEAFSLSPGEPYTVSLLMRADRPEAGADIGVYQNTGTEARARLKVSERWTPYVIHVQADGTRGGIWIRPARDEAGDHVRLWVDDVAIHPGRLTSPPRTRGSAADFTVSPARPNGVFEPDEPLTVVVRAAGFEAGADLPILCQITDAFERVVYELETDLPGAPAGEVSERVLPLPVEGLGFFRCTVSLRGRDHALTRDTRLVRYARYGASQSPIGVSRGWDVDLPWELARSAGVCWARDWLGMWDVVEAEPGRRSLLTPVTFTQRYRRLGYRVVACVPFPSASWGASVEEETWQEHGALPFAGSRAYLPDAPGSFERHVASLAEELGPSIEAIELLQEPLVSGWSMPAARYDPEDYVALCRSTASAVANTGWKGLLIGGPGAVPTDYSEEMIRALVEAGLPGELDIWNAHAYLFSLPAEALDEPGQQLGLLTDGAPLWVTELGVWGDDSRSALTPLRGGAAASELDAADTMVRAVAILMSRGAERVFFSARSVPAHAPGAGRDWLVSPAGEPRKALPILATLTGMLGPTPVAAGPVELPGATAHLFDVDGGSLAVVCPDYGHGGLRAPLDTADLDIADLCGNTLTELPTSDWVFYLRLPGGDAQQLRAMLAIDPTIAE